ncbi:DUF3613 domain-containing protein [Stenotrophomonas sp. S39]|uniref:DUF3613 domain-containing protein n=1 Tax=Stenotrophomonas sp. S39 TaxID=2767451 RepID=UPI00190C2035|nr:DUF3613 domain-containing protein [Stenotrophomonas sp. S39]MBK0055526.1 DUF3613 domain-containing protein [Stenotrophomonas sp. S39]
MTASHFLSRPRMALAASCLLWASASNAQSPQPPLTGQMMGGPLPAVAAPAPPVPVHTPATAEPLPTVDLTAPAVASAASTASMQAAPVATSSTAALALSGNGATVRHLFQLQASGTQAGARLPMLGDQATASYARYLKSFEHEIPDFFETDVTRGSGTSGSSR